MNTYLFYLLITITSIVLLKLYSRVSHRYVRLLILAGSFLSLFIPLVLRGITVGVDYVRYKDTFYEIVNSTYVDENTVGWLGWPFVFLVKSLAPLLFDNYIIFYGLICSIGLVFLYAAVLRSKIPWLSLLLFVAFCLYFQMFNQMRQIIAICIILYSIKYIQQERIIKFIATVGFAGIFHVTALLFLPMYFLARLKINRYKLFLYTGLSAALIIFASTILQLTASTSYGQAYLGTFYDVAFSTSTLQNLGVRIFMLIACLLLIKKTLKAAPEALILYNIIIYCTLMQILAVYSSAFGRLTTMFFAAYILLIPTIIAVNYKGWAYQKVVTATVALALLYQFTYYMSSNGAVSAGYDNYRLINKKEWHEANNSI